MNKLYDEHAEQSVLGAILLRKESAFIAMDMVRSEDFYLPLHARVFAAMEMLIEEGVKIDFTTVASKLGDSEVVAQLGAWSMDTPDPGNVASYARIVYDRSIARKMTADLSEALALLKHGENPYEMASSIDKLISEVGSARETDEQQSKTISELVEMMGTGADVIIPGMMNREWRTIVVSPEGGSKSTVLRAIAMCASQGFHPFSHGPIPVIRALIVDLENPIEAVVETGAKLMNFLKIQAGENYDETRLRFYRKPAGIDLRKVSDKADLQREIALQRPDLVCIGPVKKMYRRKNTESYEDSADEAMAVLDHLRIKYGFALLLEHHAAKGQGGRREMTPIGSQSWMSWPEAGISFYPDTNDPTVIHVERFRGDRLQGVSWPDVLTRDRSWIIQGTWTHGVPEVLRR